MPDAIMSLVAFPPPDSRLTKPAAKPTAPGQRMRIAGALVLAAGLLSAGLLYWLETRNAQPGVEDVIPGYSRNASRQMGIFYGHAGEMMWEWRQWFARPGNQALLIAGLAMVIAIVCFRVAWLDDEKAREQP